MSIQAAFNLLGQTVMPQVGAAAFPDTCSITADAPTSDGAGGVTYGTRTSVYTNIPCAYTPFSGATVDANGKMVEVSGYKVTTPTHYNNAGTPTRINLDSTVHQIVTNARGNEPAKTFRIVSVGDKMGVVFEVICVKEN